MGYFCNTFMLKINSKSISVISLCVRFVNASVRAIYSFFIIKSAQVPIKNPVVSPASSAMEISPWSEQPFARKSSTIRSLSSADKTFLETITWFLFLCVNYTHYVDFWQYDFNIYPLIIVPHFGCAAFHTNCKKSWKRLFFRQYGFGVFLNIWQSL